MMVKILPQLLTEYKTFFTFKINSLMCNHQFSAEINCGPVNSFFPVITSESLSLSS